MEPSRREIQESRLLFVAAELMRKKPKQDWWDGYHPDVYPNKGLRPEVRDNWTQFCCYALTRMEREETLTSLSLETQMWWREHKKADEKRKLQEAKKTKETELMRSIRSKLTVDELKLLRLL
jgi:hypothetical protein